MTVWVGVTPTHTSQVPGTDKNSLILIISQATFMTFTRLVQAHSRSLGSGALLLIHQSLIWPSHCSPSCNGNVGGGPGPPSLKKKWGGQAYGWPHQCKSRRGPGPPAPAGFAPMLTRSSFKLFHRKVSLIT